MDDMDEKILFYITRILIIIFSASVWHQHLNEISIDGDLESNSCRLYHGSFLAVTMLHFLATIVLFYRTKDLNIIYSLFNILFGAFIVMSLKPNGWLFSFKWEDCNVLYDTNDVIGRIAMFSYVLIALGSIELIELLYHVDIYVCKMKLNTVAKFTSLFVILFGCTAIMVAIAGGFS